MAGLMIAFLLGLLVGIIFTSLSIGAISYLAQPDDHDKQAHY